MDIGVRLAFLLKEKHITQKSLAARSGLTPSYINQICNGKKVPTLDALESLCSALSISVGDFFSDENEAAPARLTTVEHQLIENFRSLYNYEQDFFFDMVKNLRQKHRQTLNTTPDSVWRNADGASAAGTPLFDSTIEHRVHVSPRFSDPERFLLIEVRGNSMEPDISDGDFVVVARYTQAEQGNIALGFIWKQIIQTASTPSKNSIITATMPSYAQSIQNVRRWYILLRQSSLLKRSSISSRLIESIIIHPLHKYSFRLFLRLKLRSKWGFSLYYTIFFCSYPLSSMRPQVPNTPRFAQAPSVGAFSLLLHDKTRV